MPTPFIRFTDRKHLQFESGDEVKVTLSIAPFDNQDFMVTLRYDDESGDPFFINGTLQEPRFQQNFTPKAANGVRNYELVFTSGSSVQFTGTLIATVTNGDGLISKDARKPTKITV